MPNAIGPAGRLGELADRGAVAVLGRQLTTVYPGGSSLRLCLPLRAGWTAAPRCLHASSLKAAANGGLSGLHDIYRGVGAERVARLAAGLHGPDQRV